MATLQKAKSPGQKIKIGNQVLCGVEAVDTTPVAGRVAAFQLVHEQYTAAEQAVRAADEAVKERRALIAIVYKDLSVAIETLAVALSGDGFGRRQPFLAFGVPSPGAVRAMALEAGAEQVIELERAILRHPGISAKSSHAAKDAGEAARKLLESLEPLDELEKARVAAIAKRDAFASVWERAFHHLKVSARLADDEGHGGLFAALFERPGSSKKTAVRRSQPAKIEPAPLSVPR